jgi:uncharacterized protein with PQ loop repeat
MTTYIYNVGLAGSVILSIAFIPNTYFIVKRNRQCSEINIVFITLMILCSFLLLIYSAHFNLVPVIIANTSVLINNIVVFVYYFYLLCK